ncbi:capsid protein [Crucivirus-539]|nr:capsid protein [Crucivirus-539]
MVTIKRTEYLKDINSTIAYSVQTLAVQAGNPFVFPWLAQLSGNFEQYQLISCTFHFKSNSATALNSTNTALGSLMMGATTDILQSTYQSKNEFLNCRLRSSAAPSRSFSLSIPGSRRMYYIRQKALDPTTVDLREYDMANFFIATEGMQAASVIGELWVTYVVRLVKPRLFDALGFDVECYAANTAVSGYASATPLGTGAKTITINNLPFIPVFTSGLSFTWTGEVMGAWVIQCYWVAQANVVVVPPVLSLTNLSLITPWIGTAASTVTSPTSGVTDLRLFMQFAVSGRGWAPSAGVKGFSLGAAGTLPITNGQLFLNMIKIPDQ